jgi:hypothetical protein
VSVAAGILVGLGAAVLTILVGALLPLDAALAFVAVLLGVTAGVYLGFAVRTGDAGIAVAEGLGVAVFLALGTAALVARHGAGLVAAGFGLHALWDLAHRPGPLDAGEPAWYAAACVGYDVALAAFILIRFG